DDGVPLAYHEKFRKSELIDRIILQQDGFDRIDQSTPMNRQRYMLEFILDICDTDFVFESFEEVQPYFVHLENLCKQMNYAEFEGSDFNRFKAEVAQIVAERRAK
ncbi:MAG TPA: V-type ATP synthase subunit A, partial [Candidatus Cloacimonadota bacterium]|nr:V-type ATP synthase subunit A [Candidatus Cloacimonadota bacterium]